MKSSFLLLGAFFACSAFANDADHVSQGWMTKPTTVTAGSSSSTPVYIFLNNPSNEVRNMQFSIQWPAGWTVFSATIDAKCRSRYYYNTEETENEDGETVTKYNYNFDWKSTLDASTNIVSYVGYSNNDKPLKGSSGEILRISVKAPAGTPAGFYPVKLIGSDLSDHDNPVWCFMSPDGNPNTRMDFPETTSYIKVGAPTDENTLALSGVVPSFVTSALNDETAITTLDLSECTAINGDFNLVDKRGVVLPAEGLEANVSYTRSTNTWGTICLPFDVKNSETVKYYTLSAVSVAEGKMTFESVEDNVDIPAGTPIVYKSSNGELNLSADKLSGVPASSDYTNGFTPKGTFVNTTGTGLYIANNQFWSGTGFTVPAFRTYFEGDPIKGASYRIVVDDEVAGISELEMDENGNLHEVYNLQGQHIAAPINGQVNIIDGKKAIMK